MRTKPDCIDDAEWEKLMCVYPDAVILDQWSLHNRTRSPYEAPELGVPVLSGFPYCHPRFPDGEVRIHTSKIVKADAYTGTVHTYSGTVYYLAAPDQAYAEEYPDCWERLFKTGAWSDA